MYITFQKVKYKNFLSTGNVFLPIDFDKSATTLITGKNGQGKSTMIDALYFALFGKSFRKVKKDSLINYVNKKKTLVELEFSIRDVKYKVVRGIKPAVFEIYKDDKLVDKESTSAEYQRHLETYILQMNEKLFTQTVLLGSTNYIPFMLLTTADRRNVIESLLDIQIFSVMNDLAKVDNKTLQTRYNNTEYTIEKHNISIKHLKDHINSVKGNKKQLIQTNIDNINSEDRKLEMCLDEVDYLTDRINIEKENRDAIGNKDALNDMIKSLNTYQTQFNGLIKKNNKKIEFYQDNKECPTCEQSIDDHLRELEIKNCELSNQRFDDGINRSVDNIQEQKDKLTRIKSIQDRIDDYTSDIVTQNTNIRNHKSNIDTYRQNIQDIEKSSNTKEYETKLSLTNGVLSESQSSLETTKETLLHYETVLDLLKDDGIKSRIVKTYIPVINKLIKQYLDILEFPILFRFDEEFNEYIKVRGRDEVTFSNLSEGERSRVNLSLMFAFRQLAKVRNATHCNLLIFDEIADSSLDNAGWESFLKILKENTNDGSQNCLIISHKGDDIINKFDRHIQISKKGGRFSEIL